jgi:hypothetical protein
VVWSWQQVMLAAGLRRQLARRDLPDPTRRRLADAERAFWRVIEAELGQRAGELWSWKVEGGRIVRIPFGSAEGHQDESNAAQLWSTVYLAVKPPPAGRRATPAAARRRTPAGDPTQST